MYELFYKRNQYKYVYTDNAMSNEISHEDPGTVHITTITLKVLLTYTFVFLKVTKVYVISCRVSGTR